MSVDGEMHDLPRALMTAGLRILALWLFFTLFGELVFFLVDLWGSQDMQDSMRDLDEFLWNTVIAVGLFISVPLMVWVFSPKLARIIAPERSGAPAHLEGIDVASLILGGVGVLLIALSAPDILWRLAYFIASPAWADLRDELYYLGPDLFKFGVGLWLIRARGSLGASLLKRHRAHIE